MPDKIYDRYSLRSLHEEIGLYDRKLAHLDKYELFATAGEREQALHKLKNKRDLLADAAQRAVASGVFFRAAEVPRSMRVEEVHVAEVPSPEPPEPMLAAVVRPVPRSPFAGTALAMGESLTLYKKRKAGETRKAQATVENPAKEPQAQA